MTRNIVRAAMFLHSLRLRIAHRSFIGFAVLLAIHRKLKEASSPEVLKEDLRVIGCWKLALLSRLHGAELMSTLKRAAVLLLALLFGVSSVAQLGAEREAVIYVGYLLLILFLGSMMAFSAVFLTQGVRKAFSSMRQFLYAAILTAASSAPAFAQTQPNLENGFKHFGSYDFHDGPDIVNTMNGNWMLHSPLLPDYPQRGDLSLQDLVYGTSKTWQVVCQSDTQVPSGLDCWWTAAGLGAFVQRSMAMTVKRTVDISYGATVTYQDLAYSITTSDSAVHYMIAGTTIDTSGYQLQLSNPDANSIPGTALITDRHGNQYLAKFPAGYSSCTPIQRNELAPITVGQGGLIEPMIDDAPLPGSDRYCLQQADAQLVIDSNGNQIVFEGPSTPGDTLGRGLPLESSGSQTTDYSSCVSRFSIANAFLSNYQAPDGSTQVMKECYALIQLQTSFNAPGVSEVPNALSGPTKAFVLVTLVLADGTKWTFDYDSYGEVIAVGLPTGGSISYTWTTVNYGCSLLTPMSRAIAARTVNDNNGHSYTWNYQWGTPANQKVVNTVTDANGNDTVHTFSNLAGICGYYETTTQYYQGTGNARQLIKQVDTTYSAASFQPDLEPTDVPGNVVAISIQTTLYPSGKSNLITRQYDSGAVVFGNIKKELTYDWGRSGPGPLLKEVDTTYKWEVNSDYLNANLIDLPASVVVKDGSGCALSETDYTYDESAYLVSASITTQHGAPPSSVRGNLTTVTRWLAPTSSCNPKGGTAVITHTKWYDTGEVYQQIDALGHTTTHSYDPAYVGAYSTQTCNALNQCVSGTYDFNTGVLTSFTNENATQQASGNTPGDSQHTSLYSYDYLFRMTLAQGPADPGNNSARPQNQFSYSAPNTYPLSVQRQKAITSTVNDVSTAYFDGLGRPYQTQHAMPAGTAKIDTAYDPLSQVVSVTNPYFTSSDSTYGMVQNTYDAMGRITQTTKQDGSVTTADYHEGNCVTSTDEAGKNRRACSDALGRLTSVDEPGDTNATASPILGTGGSQAMGTVMIAGAEQSKTVTVPPSTGGSPPPRCPPHVICDNNGDGGSGGTETLLDYGSVSVSLRGRTYTASFGATNDTPASIAAALASTINADISIGVTASSSNGTLYVLSMAYSSGANYPLTVNYTWDSADFPQPSFVPTANGMSGGSDGNPIFGGHTYTTLYSYDALGNLLQVQQQGGTTTQSLWRVRTFTYDSLSRLLTSNNPETGQISYTYDADGNLISKTDAHSVVAHYTYDALHRITGKSFSDGTRGASYTYDQANLWGVSPTNPIGRMVLAYDGNHAGTLFSYDVMGHINEQWDCPPSAWLLGAGCYTVNAKYNLAGDLTKLIYPDNRVVNYGYNSGDQLDLAQLSTGYNYWSVADASFYPNGTPKQVSFGNGVSESTALNLRLQLQEEAISSPGIGTLADHTYNYGTQGSNNGNILSVSDLLNSSRTQNFSYDQLNRLATAGEQGGRWGLSFGYDPWGNFLQQNVTAGSAGMHSYIVAANNRLNGYSYDAGGNMLGDGLHTYTYDAESRISQVDGGATVYTYDPTGGDRVRKDTGTNYTEYLYFGSEILAERDQNLRWSDYIFANGKRIARADGYEHQLHLSGQMCGNCGWQWYQWGFSNLGSLVGHVVQAGDKLRWRQWLNTGSKGGLIMTMTDGTETWMNGFDILDQNGEEALRSSIYNQWNYRIADLSPLIGKTISQVRLIADGLSTPGQWDMWVEDVVYTQTDGTVQPFYSQGATVPSLYTLGSSGWTNTSAVITDCSSGCAIANTTTYYHKDQINSSRLISDGYGYPIWQATFLPYGEEYGPQIGANHYKFSGKERDSESGLDYFGARYYGSALGRFITPDWAAKATAVPYAEFADPQSLNLYTYVRNIPTTRIDADGHCPDACVIEGAIVVAIGEALKDLGIISIGVGLGWLSDHIPSPTPRGHNHGNNSRLGGRGGHGKTGTAKALPAPKSNPAPGAQTQPKASGAETGKATTLQPGPHAGESIPARGPGRDFTPAERDAINAIGRDTGCHTCGSTDPESKTGNFVPDHQPVSALNPDGTAQRLYPQCLPCSRKQGGETNAAKHAAEHPKEEQ